MTATYDSDLALPLNALGITCLLAGMTVCTRLPRLVDSLGWKLFGVGIFLAGCLGYATLVEVPMRQRTGEWFAPAVAAPEDATQQTLGVLAVAAMLVAISWIFCRRRRGDLAVLIGGGALAIAAFIWQMLSTVKSTDGATLWPVLLSGAAFLYLWWLAALVFDLVFAWHRYVRHNTMHRCLKAGAMKSSDKGQAEPCEEARRVFKVARKVPPPA